MQCRRTIPAGHTNRDTAEQSRLSQALPALFNGAVQRAVTVTADDLCRGSSRQQLTDHIRTAHSDGNKQGRAAVGSGRIDQGPCF